MLPEAREAAGRGLWWAAGLGAMGVLVGLVLLAGLGFSSPVRNCEVCIIVIERSKSLNKDLVHGTGSAVW